MYKYFVPDERREDGPSAGSVSDKLEVSSASAHSRGDIVPLYDEDGRLIATSVSFHLYSN